MFRHIWINPYVYTFNVLIIICILFRNVAFQLMEYTFPPLNVNFNSGEKSSHLVKWNPSVRLSLGQVGIIATPRNPIFFIYLWCQGLASIDFCHFIPKIQQTILCQHHYSFHRWGGACFGEVIVPLNRGCSLMLLFELSIAAILRVWSTDPWGFPKILWRVVSLRSKLLS